MIDSKDDTLEPKAEEQAEGDVPSAEPEQTSAFTDGKWFKIGASGISRSIGSFGINEIFTVTSKDKKAQTAVLTSITGQQTTIKMALLDTLKEPDVYKLASISIGDEFRIPEENLLNEQGIDMPNHVKERTITGSILKVVGIMNGGSMVEVRLANGSAFLVSAEVLSKLKRKRTKSKKA
jgi:hypothetical protein